MNIITEYKRLEAMASGTNGLKEIERAWMILTGYEQDKDGYWQSKTGSKGDGVLGFAIDPETTCYTIGTSPHNHPEAYITLSSMLIAKGVDEDEAYDRILKGWSGKILDFTFPVIFMADMRLRKSQDDTGLLERIEGSILDQGLGLPLNGFFRRLHE